MSNREELNNRDNAKNSAKSAAEWWHSGLNRRQFLSRSAATAGAMMFYGIPGIAAGTKMEAVSDKSWDALRGQIKGEVILPSASNFAQIRSGLVWNNIKPNRSPDVIVKVKDAADVAAAVNFARKNKLKVVIHGGGHNWWGLAIRDGGMTIDLSNLTDVKIYEDKLKAVIQPIVSNRDLANMLASFGVAFPTGHCPTVKASGYLLNGGMSWNMGHVGPAVQSIEAIELVTADGKMVTASKDEHPDLFWAARGCGPGMFAVATRFHLKLYPLPKAIRSSSYFYSLADLKDVVEEVTTIGREMPNKVELSIFMQKAPAEIADKCKDFNGFVCLASAVAFGDTEEESRAALAPLETGKMPAKALMKSLNNTDTFDTLSTKSGGAWPPNHRNLAENMCSHAKPVDIYMAVRDKFIKAPSEKSIVVFCQTTGETPLLVPDPSVALDMDGTSYGGVWSIWEDEKQDAANSAWHQEMVALLQPFQSGHYVGETDVVTDEKRIAASYTKSKWERLEKIRAQYDPDGVFFGWRGLKNA